LVVHIPSGCVAINQIYRDRDRDRVRDRDRDRDRDRATVAHCPERGLSIAENKSTWRLGKRVGTERGLGLVDHVPSGCVAKINMP
jgi:hypothetical protein